MNFLIKFFAGFWGKPGNLNFLNYYQCVLKMSNIWKDMKKFYECNIFFRYVVDIYIDVLLIKTSNPINIDKFKA